MPQSITVEPEEVLAPGSIHFTDIPVNTYRRTLGEERARYSTEEFLNIWQDMCAQGDLGGGAEPAESDSEGLVGILQLWNPGRCVKRGGA
jgi:hypothetical protein